MKLLSEIAYMPTSELLLRWVNYLLRNYYEIKHEFELSAEIKNKYKASKRKTIRASKVTQNFTNLSLNLNDLGR